MGKLCEMPVVPLSRSPPLAESTMSSSRGPPAGLFAQATPPPPPVGGRHVVVVVLVVVVVVVVVVVGHAPVGCGVQTSTSCPRSVLGLVPFTAWASSVTTRLPGFFPFFLSFTVIGVTSLQSVSVEGAGKVSEPGSNRGALTVWIPAALHAGAAVVSLRQ